MPLSPKVYLNKHIFWPSGVLNKGGYIADAQCIGNKEKREMEDYFSIGLKSGYMGGSLYGHKGAAVDYLCMPKSPDWNYKYKDGVSTYRGYVYGAEYENQDNDVDIGRSHLERDVPCAVCRAVGSTSVLMIPGKTKCENSWTKQYGGYLMAGRWLHKAASQYICVDKDAEVIPGSSTPKNGVLVYPVEARCGSLKCPPYVEGRELACAVCSK